MENNALYYCWVDEQALILSFHPVDNFQCKTFETQAALQAYALSAAGHSYRIQ